MGPPPSHQTDAKTPRRLTHVFPSSLPAPRQSIPDPAGLRDSQCPQRHNVCGASVKRHADSPPTVTARSAATRQSTLEPFRTYNPIHALLDFTRWFLSGVDGHVAYGFPESNRQRQILSGCLADSALAMTKQRDVNKTHPHAQPLPFRPLNPLPSLRGAERRGSPLPTKTPHTHQPTPNHPPATSTEVAKQNAATDLQNTLQPFNFVSLRPSPFRARISPTK
jgi:hypothetical protein